MDWIGPAKMDLYPTLDEAALKPNGVGTKTIPYSFNTSERAKNIPHPLLLHATPTLLSPYSLQYIYLPISTSSAYVAA